MHISNHIDKLISSLNGLKPLLSDDQISNNQKFSNILKQAAQSLPDRDTVLEEEIILSDQKKTKEIPDWVDPDYGYDPENPRKPFMGELVEAITGKKVEELYSDPNSNWKVLFKSASSMLYGVLGSSKDTRNWSKIMSEEDILAAARLETNKMYEPSVDIVSNFNTGNEPVDQIAVIKDKNGTILIDIPKNLTLAEEILENFGAKNASIPTNLKDKVDFEKFDNHLLDFLENFDKQPQELDQVALETTIKNISNRLSEEIPLSEYDKL